MARTMKPSGIEWIGNIPEEWEISHIGNCYTERKTKVSDYDYSPLSVTMKGIMPQLATAAKTDAHDDRKLVKKGDFAINSRSDRRGSCGISEFEGSVSLINTVLTPRKQMDPRYYNWLFHCSVFSDEFYKWGHGIVDDLWTTNWQDMKRITIPAPKYEEQKVIADYLDRKCAEIDRAIAETEKTIEEYKALKQSIITKAVTKGIRDNQPMKDSGFDWIGEIADDFKVSRLKYLLSSKLIYGANESGILYNPDLPRYIRITDITLDGKLKDTGKQSLTEEQANDYLLADNDILFARSGATVGKTFIYKSEFGRSAFAGYLIKASLDHTKIIPDYLFLYTQSSLYEEWKKQIFVQATIQNIGADKYNNLPIIYPSIEEQRKIVLLLKSRCLDIEHLIEAKQKLLCELESYKKSFIYEYVNGKKEVKI